MAVSFGMLSTYPPTQCGLATFSQALTTHLVGSGADVGIVRVVDCPQPAQRRVVHELVIGQRAGARAAAGALNQYDVAYGCSDSSIRVALVDLAGLLAALHGPR